MTTVEMQGHVTFERIARAAVKKGGMKNVAVLTGDMEAQGHGFFVDQRCLDLFLQLITDQTVPSYLTHEGARADRLGMEIGMFSDFTRDDLKVRAGTFQFLQSFQTDDAATFNRLVDLADNHPDQLGVSPVVRYFTVWCLPDGSEIDTNSVPDRPTNSIRPLPSMRPLAVLSLDFVKNPAANVGLFSAKSHRVDEKRNNNSPTTMPDKTFTQAEHTAALEAKQGEITALSAQHRDAIAALKAEHSTALAALQTQLNAKTTEAASAVTARTQAETALAAKQTELEEVQKYDMRKAGAPALQVALDNVGGALPAPGKTDQENWDKYAGLCTAVKNERGDVIRHDETPRARLFKEKYLTKKAR